MQGSDVLDEIADFKNWLFNDPFSEKKFFQTGSRVITDPSHYSADTDIDLVCIYNDTLSGTLQRNGYVISPHAEYPNNNLAACYRKGRLNIIAVRDEQTYQQWFVATELGKLMRLDQKFQRVILFQFVTEGGVRGSDTIGPPVDMSPNRDVIAAQETSFDELPSI